MTLECDGARRRFLTLGLTAGIATLACSVVLPSVSLAGGLARRKGSKILNLRNLHTDEKLKIAYWRDGFYNRAALGKINYLLRDHRCGEEHSIDLSLLDLLYDLRGAVGSDAELEIISGYRAPETNASMAKASRGVAQKSYHTKGMAVDINLPGTTLSKLRKTALTLERGGVGFYPRSGFVHVDVGPVRHW